MTTSKVLTPPPPRLAPAFVSSTVFPSPRLNSKNAFIRPLRSPPLRPRLPSTTRPARMSQVETVTDKSVQSSVPSGSVRLSLLGFSGIFNARLVILGVPFLWGSFPAVGKLLYKLPWAVSPILFNAIRLLLSAACVLPSTIKELRCKSPDRSQLLRAGAELGFWTFLNSTLQIIGLRHTTASKAAFLTQLQTVLVPLFALFVGLASSLSWHVWAASTLALTGVGLLTLDDASAALTVAGDGLMLLCAVVSAIFVLRTRAVATKLRPAPLVAYKVTFQMFFAFALILVSNVFSTSRAVAASTLDGGLASVFAGATPSLVLLNIMLVVWAGAFISAMSTWLHVRAGAVVSAPETAVIFSFTPLCTSALSIFLGERFGVKGIIGGALIVLSTILSSRAPPPKSEVDAVKVETSPSAVAAS